MAKNIPELLNALAEDNQTAFARGQMFGEIAMAGADADSDIIETLHSQIESHTRSRGDYVEEFGDSSFVLGAVVGALKWKEGDL